MLSRNKREHYTPLFKELNILPFNELIQLKRANFMWKLNKNLLPTSSKWFKTNNSEIMQRLHLSKYRIPNPRTEYAKRYNTYTATRLWNTEIPDNLKASTTVKKFNSNYKTLLLATLQ